MGNGQTSSGGLERGTRVLWGKTASGGKSGSLEI